MNGADAARLEVLKREAGTLTARKLVLEESLRRVNEELALLGEEADRIQNPMVEPVASTG